MTREEFEILRTIKKNSMITQRQLAENVGCSVGKINKLIYELKGKKYIDNDYLLTQMGKHALEPYKVKNAIILAAGFSSRCAPLSYEKPKGLFKVKNEILIERQIKQLQERGIKEIFVVVGYMKELFFYLEEKYGVTIITNTEYMIKNNISSIYAAQKYFGNSYICYSDNYIVNNGYEEYVYQSYFAALFSAEYTDEYVINCDKNGRINQYYQGGEKCWYQMGEMYFDKNTAKTFLNLLIKEYNYPNIYDMKVDDFYMRHLSQLDIYIKKYPLNSVIEFDTISEIKKFDDMFVQNMGENILTNICDTLDCVDSDITNVEQIKKGMTNIIFSFECKGQKYVYRHPGKGTEQIINRNQEAFAQSVAQEAGLDSTLIKCEPLKGWKISRYIENVAFDYSNLSDEARGVQLIKSFHLISKKLGWEFNMLKRAEDMQQKVSRGYYDAYNKFSELRDKISELYYYTKLDGYDMEMCHNDVCDSNILLCKEGTYLIDWEYAGDNDPAADIASFIIGAIHTEEDVYRILEMYFERKMNLKEERHYLAYIAICGYFYFTWAIYKESTGQDIGEFTYMWYSYALTYCKKALAMYKN